MTVLTDTRQSTSDLLADALGVQAHPAMPDRLVPPCAVVIPGTPYLTAGATFGTFTDQLSVVLITDAKVSATGTDALDELTENAIVALVNAGISVSEVSEPWQVTAVNGSSFLAVTLTTTQPVAL